MIDAKRLREDVDLVALIERYVPSLRKSGSEFQGLCPFHDESTPSFTVVPAKHFWHCFGCAAHGDAIDFVREMHGCGFREACDILGGKDVPAVTPRARPAEAPEPEWTPIMPVPKLAPALFDDGAAKLYNPKRAGTEKEWTTLRPAKVYEYTDDAGNTLGYVFRCEFTDGGKFTPQITFCQNKEGQRRWCIFNFPAPRPLYGLQDLKLRPSAPVLVVEGEKCKDAAARLLPTYVVVSNPGGSHGVGHTDWRPLLGRDVLVWPDADDAGMDWLMGWFSGNGAEAGGQRRKGLRDILLGNVPRLRWLDPAGQPDGWDVADAEKAGWDGRKIILWAKNHVKDVAPVPEPVPSEPPAKGAATDQGSVNKEPASQAAPSPAEPPFTPLPPSMAQEPKAPAKPQRQAARASRGPTGVVTEGGAVKLASSAPAQQLVPADQIGMWAKLGLETSSRGSPYQNLDNVVRVLLNHPATAGHIWYDEFYCQYFTDWDAPHRPSRAWSDADDLHLAIWLQREIGLVKVGDDLARRAMLTVGQLNKHDEPREWMTGLQWDGTPRIEQSLCHYFGSEENQYIRDAAKNFWISMVARVMSPGCQVDNMLVLESEQGQYKSSALGIIGGKWYAEAHESVTNKDFFMALQGVMLMEIAELDSFGKVETTKVKQVITCRSDRFRVPYGRTSQNHPRRNVFVGTTNQGAYLMDATGARRFWPVKCGRIHVDELRHDREQLFAEAVVAHAEGRAWWLVKEDEAKFAQESRRQADSWEEQIANYLQGRDETNVIDVATFGLEMPVSAIDRRVQHRIADALTVLGYQRYIGKEKTRGGWQSKRGWRKKTEQRELGD